MKDSVGLVVSARGGDVSAFEALIREFRDMAVGYAYSILLDFHLAEDAAQEAFIECYANLPQLRDAAAFPAWFRRVVFKHCDRLVRGKRVSAVPLEEAMQVESSDPGPAESLERRELQEVVKSAIQVLPKNERAVTTLFYINGYSQAEVGDFLGLPIPTVKNRLNSARKRLQERMVVMVEDTLKVNAPGEAFTRKVADAVGNLKTALASPARKKTIRSGHWFPELTGSLRWQILLSEHLMLHYYHDAVHSQAFAGELLDMMERLYTEVMEFLIPPPRSKQERISVQGRCSCFIVHTDSERTFGTLEDSNTLFYLMDPERYPEYPSRLRHEIAHLIWGKLYGEAPPLFNEGLAVYAEHMSAPDADFGSLLAHDTLLLDDIPPLVKIVDDDNFWKYGPFYGVGGVLVCYLVENYGWDALRRFFLASDYDDPKALRHFAEVYCQDLMSVDSDWRDYLRARTI